MTVPSKSQCHHDGDDRFEAFEKEILEACKRTWDDDVQANENAESILAELHRCDASGREYYMTDRGEYYYYVVRHFDVDGYVKSFFDELHRVDGFIKPGSYIRDEQPMGALEHVVEVGSLGDSKHMEPLEYMEAIEKGLPDRKSLFFTREKMQRQYRQKDIVITTETTGSRRSKKNCTIPFDVFGRRTR